MPVRQPYLQELEAESIHVLREAAAVFRNPVILYSIGKDSSVLLHLRTAEMSVEREIDAIIEAMRECGIID